MTSLLLALAIAWSHDEAQARKSGRPLLIEFSAAWCGACQMLERHTWSDAKVQREVAAHFQPLLLDVTEQTAEQQQLMQKYGVTSLPTILIVGPGASGKTTRVSGYAPPEELLRLLEEASQKD